MQALRAIRVVTIWFTLMSCLLFLCAINCRAQQINCSSACGSIQNIRYPFRLTDDPSSCGHPSLKYELSCIDNRTILYLSSKLYLVVSINYGNFTIRLLDPGLGKNCSAFPRYTLMDDVLPAEYFHDLPTDINTPVIFISCRNPQESTLYVNTEAGFCSNNTLSNIWGYTHSYVLVGNDVNLGNLKDSCSMTAVAWVSLSFQIMPSTSSFREIRDALAWGFELSWQYYPLQYCSADCNGYCVFDFESNNTTCISSYYECTLRPRRLKLTLKCLKELLENGGYRLIGDAGKRIGYFALGRFILGLLFLTTIVLHKLRRLHLSAYDSIEDYLSGPNNLMPIRYTYWEIKQITGNFKHKLGEGGFGVVFKGTLRSGPFVAVKMLGKSKATGQDFVSEVATIGRIHHTNVVRLIGFCVEGSKRALLYEFMPNGSLDRYTFPKEEKSFSLSYWKMFEIALGVARGIDYLHRGCDMRILHFDIKPHNILLDENFSPKVSDFGLAKLYPTEDSLVSLTAARGTMGYMAPELCYRNIGKISHKADVYSFGMLLMEMAGRRKNLNPSVEHTSQIYFPSWVYEQVKDGKDIDIGDATDDEKKLAKKMIIVALWCIQMNPGDRPGMNKVMEMLEGDVELLEMPPKPFLSPDELPSDENSIVVAQNAESPLLSDHPMRSSSLEVHEN